MKMILASLLALSSLVYASDKDFPPGCLTGADNSKVALVVMDNYTAEHGTNASIERLKKSIQAGQPVFINEELLASMQIESADAKAIIQQIQSADNAN